MAKVKIPTQLVDVVLPDNSEHSPSRDEQKRVAEVAKKVILDVLEQGISPKLTALMDEGSVSFYYNLTFPQKEAAKIRQCMRDHKQPEGLMLFYLLSAGIEKELYVDHLEASPDSAHLMNDYLSPLSLQPRKEQLILSDNIADTIARNGVGLIEGGTGIGKSLTILANANQIATERAQRAVIATNTISNIKQLAKTYDSLTDAGVSMVPMRMIFGKNSFVSVERLNRYLSEEDVPSDAASQMERWAKTGLAEDRAIDMAPAYLVEELVAIYPGVVVSEVILQADLSDDDPGAKSYKEQFKREGIYPEVVICTHAMLAVDAKARKIRLGQNDHEVTESLQAVRKEIATRISALSETTGEARKLLQADIDALKAREDDLAQTAYQDSDLGILPVYQFLFIDEAHLFEETVSKIISANISFRSFLKDIKACAEEGSIPAAKLKEILKEANTLLNAEGLDRETITLEPGVEHFHALSRIVTLLKSIKKYSKLPDSRKNQVSVLQRAISQAESPYHLFRLMFSPVRRYPQIMAGEVNTQAYLRSIWQQVTAAVCISATLYFPKMGGYSCAYFANTLAVPESRLRKFAPITPPWLKSKVNEVVLPPASPEGARPFVPVGRQHSGISSEERQTLHENWLGNLQSNLAAAHEQGNGGTLVLMTSFSDVKALSQRLQDTEHPLVLADGSATTEEQKTTYLAALKNGQKPIWLALGGAWTGLDINGRDIGLSNDEIAEKDNVITTLAIPKLPFGLNRSLSHYARMSKSHQQATLEVMETVIRFKQGLGRLVRLENQPQDRKILILDGRLSLPEYKGFLGPIQRVIESYPRIRHLGAVE